MRLSAVAVGLLIWFCLPATAEETGAELYAQHCAQCHDAGDPQSRIPNRTALQSMAFEHVLRAITSGSMAPMVKDRTEDERKAIASFVTGRLAGDGALAGKTDTSGHCVEGARGFDGAFDRPRWAGWGADINNSRFQ